jgi:hypothetical protein
VPPPRLRSQQEVARRQSSPFTGKLSARPAGKPGDFLIAKESLRRSLPRHLLPAPAKNTEAPQYAFLEAWRNLSGPMGFQKSKPNPEPRPNRLPPVRLSPGKGTRREDHAPSHRPQMSSGRLFLDRVGRHQSPSPLHRHEQHNMRSPEDRGEGDISTLPAWGHFYFALTYRGFSLQTA